MLAWPGPRLRHRACARYRCKRKLCLALPCSSLRCCSVGGAVRRPVGRSVAAVRLVRQRAAPLSKSQSHPQTQARWRPMLRHQAFGGQGFRHTAGWQQSSVVALHSAHCCIKHANEGSNCMDGCALRRIPRLLAAMFKPVSPVEPAAGSPAAAQAPRSLRSLRQALWPDG